MRMNHQVDAAAGQANCDAAAGQPCRQFTSWLVDDAAAGQSYYDGMPPPADNSQSDYDDAADYNASSFSVVGR
eukprot:CAMPEP_0172320302 /NCGR_PEP_ID=MMETSP1058-20130122/40226_1 /TAXON_ID=83371 /ORGANISM="Detonula confervacea, Strain CCMP 353" /LENGTH=72 /DNA_ID=CAMNT_0013035537 /DNA_START=110 /DNA_END=328 /DNA_ORIENTATION=+